jgi:hypothetical protein
MCISKRMPRYSWQLDPITIHREDQLYDRVRSCILRDIVIEMCVTLPGSKSLECVQPKHGKAKRSCADPSASAGH